MRFVLCLVSVWLALAAPAHANPCARDELGVSYRALLLDDPHITRLFSKVYQRSHLTSKVYLCEYLVGDPMPHTIIVPLAHGAQAYSIFVPAYLLRVVADDELRGVFAHELGHVELFQPVIVEALLRQKNVTYLGVEMRCDAFGARLVGSYTMMKTLAKMEQILLPKLSHRDQEIVSDYVDARIEALQALSLSKR